MKAFCDHGHPYDVNRSPAKKPDGTVSYKCAECLRVKWQKKGDEYRRRYREKHGADALRERERDRKRRYFAKHPEKYQAKMKLYRAVRNGTLVKPDACERCDRPLPSNLLEGSHDDYNRPLDVEWLCRKCHAAKDRKYAAIGPPAYAMAVPSQQTTEGN